MNQVQASLKRTAALRSKLAAMEKKAEADRIHNAKVIVDWEKQHAEIIKRATKKEQKGAER